ncbi:sensor histidine kinase [Methanobacterium congolense]|uniref:histidine kinase n=1 Tax=Methanobacterium congolense TaxID=118062 RepID=A0A1D3L3V1_9EURY|nr:ATP-binding protein [Methanobacterium congolense]SCG86238.1 Cyanobacterial phytochrome A [Methanobacterium congolense]
MLKDDNNVKLAYEKEKKVASERAKQFEESEISSDVTQTDEFLQAVQNRSWLNLTLRYVLSILVVMVSFGLYFVLTALFGPGLPTYILFYPAIIIVAMLAGLGPGLLATIISVMLAVIWIIPPVGQFTIKTPIEEIGVVLFTSFGILISSVAELYRRNRNKAAAYDKEKALRETQREKEFLADILEHASQPFAIGYPDGRMGLLNHAFEQLTGYTTEELHNIDWSTTLTPTEWREMENQKLDELNRTGQPTRYEKEYIRKDGSRVPIELLVSIQLDVEGNPEFYYSFITDISERKKTEKIIETTMNELEHSNKELEQFAYITSHDLREPLRMITSFLQLLERRYKDQLDEDANEFIGFAVDGAKRLDAMTNDLLQYSKITSEKRELKPVNFEDVLQEALLNLKVPIEESNAVITHDPLPTIKGDEHLKVQLFQNIIGNAIKYRSQETPKIHISTKKEKNQYLFSFKDNGIGMSSEHLERIFTIFQRLHTHYEYEGTGIGLAIAQKIVHQQGGQIWVESELGKGSTFYFSIPTQNANN